MTLAFIGGLAIGCILGGLLVLAAFTFIVYLDEKNYQPEVKIREIEKKIRKKVDKREPKIFNSPSDLELAQDKIIQEHTDRGEDTPLEQL